MGVTRFPNGISVGTEGAEVYPITGGDSALLVRYNSGTVITGAGTVATGLTAVSAVVPALAGTLLGTAVAGSPNGVNATASGGNVILKVHDVSGSTAATGSGTVTFIAIGT